MVKADPFIGILMLNTKFTRLVGDIGHPDTFPFPIKRLMIDEANSRNVVIDGEVGLADAFCRGARRLEEEGACAIATSCGFLACFQKELAQSVSIPVGASALLLVPLIAQLFGNEKKIGVLTARKSSMSDRQLLACGVDRRAIALEGMEDTEFYRVYVENKAEVDKARLSSEILERGMNLVARDGGVGAILLECTNMPPFAGRLRSSAGVPVFDVRDLVWALHRATCGYKE